MAKSRKRRQHSKSEPQPADHSPKTRQRDARPGREAAELPAARPPLTIRQKVLLLALGPFLILMLEGVLRLFGVAALEPLFVDVCPREGGGTWVQANHNYMRPFFSRRVEGHRVTTGQCIQNVFVAPKPRDLIRVAFLGASTVQGYPHPRNNTSSAFLEAMLNDCVEEGKRVEILNLGYVAIASYPVACLAGELERAEPDLVVVYAGQNEFFGAYGTLSSQFGGRSVAAMRLRRAFFGARLVRLMSSGIESLRTRQARPDRPLIEVMVGRRLDKPGGKATTRAASNLETNLRTIARHCRALGIPAVFCTLVSNEKDVAPFASAERDGLSTEERHRWRSEMTAAESLLTSAPKRALEHLERARAIYAEHALLDYRIGRAEEALGDKAGAVEASVRAIDLDGLPWRAPSAMNEAVRAACSQGVILADVQQAFRAESDGGPIGWSLIVDHVHPSVRGQALMARTIVEALAGDNRIAWIDPQKFKSMPPLEEYLRRLDNGALGRFFLAYRMASLFRRSGFFETNRAAADHHRNQALSILEEMDEPSQLAARQRFGEDDRRVKPISIHYLAAQRYRDAGQIRLALRYADAALPTIDPYSEQYLDVLAFKIDCFHRLGNGHQEEIQAAAGAVIDCAQVTARLSDKQFMIQSLLANACGLAGKPLQAADAIVAAWKAGDARQQSAIAPPLAQYLSAVGQKAEAIRLLQNAVRQNPSDSRLRKTLKSLDGESAPARP